MKIDGDYMNEMSTKKSGRKKGQENNTTRDAAVHTEQESFEAEPINAEQQKIIQWLKKVHFKKRIFGGVSEADVWKKIGELNTMYDAALAAERIRYDTMIEHYRKTCLLNVQRYKKQCEQVGNWMGETSYGEKVNDE